MGDYCRGLTAHVIHSTLRYTQWVSDRRVPAIRRAARVRQPAHGLPLRIDGALHVTICSDTPPCKIRHTCLGCILTGRGVHTHTHTPPCRMRHSMYTPCASYMERSLHACGWSRANGTTPTPSSARRRTGGTLYTDRLNLGITRNAFQCRMHPS